MKYYFCLFFCILIALTSCKSNEDKASELIKDKLSKTLYDFESYEPIETIVEEAYQTPYNDSTCFHQAMIIGYGMSKVQELLEDAKNSQEHMDIWGAPTAYSSTYSDRQYYKYRDEAREKLDEATTAMAYVKSLGLALQDSISNLDKTKPIGWVVNHRFRCKTKGGHSTIGEYRYIIDRPFKKILFYEDRDDEDYSKAHEIIEMAEKNGFSDSSED